MLVYSYNTEMIPNIPIVELFLAGVFAVISTESVKWLFNVRESSIGLHSTSTGELMKARHATIIFTVIIFASNIMAFLIYSQIHQYISNLDFRLLNSTSVDIVIVLLGILLVWGYLKKNHYNRTA